MVVRPIFPYVQRFKDKRFLGNVELLAKLLDTNHLETWENVRAFEEKQTEVLENCRAELAELIKRCLYWKINCRCLNRMIENMQCLHV